MNNFLPKSRTVRLTRGPSAVEDMDTKKILKELARVRSAYEAMGRDLEQIERELEKDQVPDPPRKRKNLKEARIEKFERFYASKS